MRADRNNEKPISAQRLPISIAAPRPRAYPAAARPAAAFLAQLLTGRPNIAPARANQADCSYRRAEQSDIKRVPPGYRTNRSA